MKMQRLLEIVDKCESIEQRKKFVEVALGLELSYSLPLPSGKVDSVIAYFEEHHTELVQRVISELNEIYPISVNVTYNIVVDSYKNRYCLCHEPRALSISHICSQLSRASFEQSVTPEHLTALQGPYSSLGRSELSDFIGRYID